MRLRSGSRFVQSGCIIQCALHRLSPWYTCALQAVTVDEREYIQNVSMLQQQQQAESISQAGRSGQVGHVCHLAGRAGVGNVGGG